MNTRRMSIALIAFMISLLLAPIRATTDENTAPNTGFLKDNFYHPGLDAICGIGEKLSEGCNAIREREIVDASAYPWSAVGQVNFASTQIRMSCTGTLLSEKIVLTAAHCLYNLTRKQWIPANSIRFIAGYQRGEYEAISDVERYVLDPTHDPESREFKGEMDVDWALLILKDPIGKDVRFVDLYLGGPDAIAGKKALLAGYPSLRHHVLSVARDCGEINYDMSYRVLVSSCSAMQGDSGAPIFVSDNGNLKLAGNFSSIAATLDPKSLFSVGVPVANFQYFLQLELEK